VSCGLCYIQYINAPSIHVCLCVYEPQKNKHNKQAKHKVEHLIDSETKQEAYS
jgi:hypothetical protein